MRCIVRSSPLPHAALVLALVAGCSTGGGTNDDVPTDGGVDGGMPADDGTDVGHDVRDASPDAPRPPDAADATPVDGAAHDGPGTDGDATSDGAPGPAGPLLGVYRWGAPKGPPQVDAFGTWLGRSVDLGEDFEANDTWSNAEGPGWQVGPWHDWTVAHPGQRVVMTVTMLPGPWDNSLSNLTDCAAGTYDAHWKTLGQSLVDHGLGDSVLRLGHEFNGGWYTWRAKDQPDKYAGCFRAMVKQLRTAPGQTFHFDWNSSVGVVQFPAEDAYPGDDVVDTVGVDVYDQSWATDTYPIPAGATDADAHARRERAWTELHDGDHGLVFWRDFAKKHGKPLSIPEWGVTHRGDGHGGEDNPEYVQHMFDFVTDPASHVAYHVYFDVGAPDGDHQLSIDTKFPNAAAKFKALFGK